MSANLPVPRSQRPVVHLVSHTHWDREWYHRASVFRQRLVPLMDDLLAQLRNDADLTFLLDGQAIALEDYLDVRPEKTDAVSSMLAEGRIEAGPWYVLADELIPPGELLIRNLLAGRRVLRRLGAKVVRVLYSPDSFGHPEKLPALAEGFGFPLAVVWRGFGGEGHPEATCAEWKASDGSSVLLHHLPRSGYELGAALPADDASAKQRWDSISAQLLERDNAGVLLLPNGADHHALQRNLVAAVAALSRAASGSARILRSSLSAFARQLVQRARRIELPVVTGELRNSYGYTWTLQGTFASRSSLKRQLAFTSRMLLREGEVWSALAAARGHASAKPLLDAAFKPLLQSLPHDTICGCSSDEVAEEAMLRLRDAEMQGREIAVGARRALAGYESEMVRSQGAAPRPDIVLIHNSSARTRGGVAHVLITRKVRDVRVGPGSALQPPVLPTPAPLSALRPLSSPGTDTSCALQLLSSELANDLLESPQHYPDADIVENIHALAWVPAVPAFGMDSFGILTGDSELPDFRPIEYPAFAAGGMISNGLVAASIGDDGVIVLEGCERGLNHAGLQSSPRTKPNAPGRVTLALETVADDGDLYTPSPRGIPRLWRNATGWTVKSSGPLRSEVSASIRFSTMVENSPTTSIVIPHPRGDASLHDSDATRSSHPADSLVRIALSIDAGSHFVRMSIEGSNYSSNCRLRLLISGDMQGVIAAADAPLGTVMRDTVAFSDSAIRDEFPPPTDPLHRYVTILSPRCSGALFSDSLGEFEVLEGRGLAVTLLRSVGQLSRHNLPERPGNAGWPMPTPAAQEHGAFTRGYAWMPMSFAEWDDLADDVERAADDFLHPLAGETLRSSPVIPARSHGAELEGSGLTFSAIKQSENRKWLVLRASNTTSRRVRGSWKLGHPIREAALARLDETVMEPLSIVRGSVVKFAAPPHALVTILVR